jgi:phosphatidylethanolamine/phosphatidyl-N-methylethanolamine N-methyltransferase
MRHVGTKAVAQVAAQQPQPQPRDSLAFLRGWSRNPVAVGGPFASSPWTARRLARAVLAAVTPEGGPILELGAGTGPVTKALAAEGWPPERIVAVERDPELCRYLNDHLPGLRVVQGDALDLAALRARIQLKSVSAVLSGLPMRAIAPDAASRCYDAAFQLMPSNGTIIQYTYGFRPPVDPARSPLALDAAYLGREWRNLPPMAIWRYRLARGRRAAT